MDLLSQAAGERGEAIENTTPATAVKEVREERAREMQVLKDLQRQVIEHCTCSRGS